MMLTLAVQIAQRRIGPVDVAFQQATGGCLQTVLPPSGQTVCAAYTAGDSEQGWIPETRTGSAASQRTD